MIIWMSVTSAILYGIWPEWPVRNVAHIFVQTFCLLAASVQAGFLETGIDSKLRKPMQFAAMASYVTCVVTCHPECQMLVSYLTRL